MKKVIWLSNKDAVLFNNRPSVNIMKEFMHEKINQTILNYIMHERVLWKDDSHIKSMLLNHPIMCTLLHPYSGVVDVKMSDAAIIKHCMYVMCCEKASQTEKIRATNKLVDLIRDILHHANIFISSEYYGKILDMNIVKHMTKLFNDNNRITFNNVIHIKLTHDINEYSFKYIMHMKPDITAPTMDDKTKRFYDKI